MKKVHMFLGCLAAGTVFAADPVKVQMPDLPAGVAPKVLNDMEDERSVLAAATDAALTKGGFDDMIERLSTPDRKRIGDFAEREFADIDGRIDQIRKNWTTKYGKDFDAEQAVFDGFVMIKEGEVTNGAEFSKGFPVPASASVKGVANHHPDSLKLYDTGRNVAIAHFPASHNLPPVTVSMIHEAVDDWRIDVPDNVSGEQIHAALKTALTHFGDNVAAWPADVKDAYQTVGHHLALSLYAVPMDANARTAAERQGPTDARPAQRPERAQPAPAPAVP